MNIQKETATCANRSPLSTTPTYTDGKASSIDVKSIRVSRFDGAFNPTPCGEVNVGQVLTAIRTGKTKDDLSGQIEQYRAKHRSGDESASVLKLQLPAVTFSGTFTERKNSALRQHSGLLCADLDKLGDSLSDVREKLKGSPHIWTLFVSPSGNGLKAVFRVPADIARHAGGFRAIERHVLALIDAEIDQACKDPARLCLLSYDPKLYVNESAIAIEPLPEPEPKSLSNGTIDLNERQRIATEILENVDWQSATSGLVTCPGKHLHTQGDGVRDCGVELDNVPTIHCFHNSCRGVVDALNYTLRSRVGKAEWMPPSSTTGWAQEASSVTVTNDEGATELPPPRASYVSPPLTLLPETLREYVESAASAINVDISFVYLPLLPAIGSAIGNTRSILLKHGYVEPPIIWTGIIGASGQKKSPGINAGCDAVVEQELELMRQNKVTATSYDEELATWESKSRKERGVKPTLPVSLTCLMDDMTLEALAEAIEHNPRGVLVKKDELSHWFASFDQYHSGKGTDVSRWLSLHTGVFFGVDRRSDHRRYRIHNPRVCITGGIQPEVLKRALTDDFFERGLPARFIFAAPPKRAIRWTEDIVPGHLRDAVLKLLDGLWLLQPEHDEYDNQRPKLLALSPDAKAEFVAFYNECGTMETDERGEAAFHKLPAYAARFALIGQLAADPGATLITGEAMQAACDLARWEGKEAERIYACITETPEQRETRKLIECIHRHGGSVTARDMMRSMHTDKDETERRLGALVKKGLAKWETVPTTAKGGHPTRKCRLLPAVTVTQPRRSPSKPGGCVTVTETKSAENTGSAPLQPEPLQVEQVPGTDDFRHFGPPRGGERVIMSPESEPEKVEIENKCTGMFNRYCRCKSCEEFRQGKWVYPFNDPEWVQLFPNETQPHWQAARKEALVKPCSVCGERHGNDPYVWLNMKSQAVQCCVCRETHWWADGHEIDEDGLPSCWNHNHTREERIAERDRDQLQKAAAYRARAEGGTAQAWYAVLLAQEPQGTRQAIAELDSNERQERETRRAAWEALTATEANQVMRRFGIRDANEAIII